MSKISEFFYTLGNLLGSNKNKWFFFRDVSQQGEVWIDVSKPYEIYKSIPEARTVIDRIAAMYSNAVVKHYRNDAEVENSPYVSLFKKTSPIATQNGFMYEQIKQYLVYGNYFCRKMQPSNLAPPKNLHNISPRYMVPDVTGKLFDQTTIEGIVKQYKYRDASGTTPIPTNEVLWIAEADLDNPLVGQSKLETLQYPLSNIKGAYSYRNAIINKKGALGFYSSDNKDQTGVRPMREEDRVELSKQESEVYGHGEGQTPFKIVGGAVKFTPTSYPTKDMLLFEEVAAGYKAICDLYGMNFNIFNNNSTYENLSTALIQSYEDCIFPLADMFSQRFTEFLGLPENEKIVFDYSHLEVLKRAKLQGSEAANRTITAVSNAVQLGLLPQAEGARAVENITSSFL